MKNHFEINVLGTSFTIQTDEDPEYIKQIIEYLEEKIKFIESTIPVKNTLKISLLACIFIIDELFKTKNSSENEEVSLIAEKLISSIDTVLEDE